MAKKTETKQKVILKRTYNVPLRREFQKAPKYKRAKKAVKALREFLVRHMKSEDVKIGKFANMNIWENGIRNPPHHLKVEASKYDNGMVYAQVVGAPAEQITQEEAKEKSKKGLKEKKAKKEEKEGAEAKEDKKQDKKKEKTVDAEIAEEPKEKAKKKESESRPSAQKKSKKAAAAKPKAKKAEGKKAAAGTKKSKAK